MFSNDSLIAELYSEPLSIEFLAFLLAKAQGHPIGMLLERIKVPRASELIKVHTDLEKLRKTFESLIDKISVDIESLFLAQVQLNK